MIEEQNKVTVRGMFEELLNKRNFLVIEECMASDFIHNGPGARQIQGQEQYRQNTEFLLNAIPDINITIEDMIAQGNKVVTRWTIQATHSGEFMGVPPTGKVVSWTGITITLLENGSAVEDWFEQDTAGLMRQLSG